MNAGKFTPALRAVGFEDISRKWPASVLWVHRFHHDGWLNLTFSYLPLISSISQFKIGLPYKANNAQCRYYYSMNLLNPGNMWEGLHLWVFSLCFDYGEQIEWRIRIKDGANQSILECSSPSSYSEMSWRHLRWPGDGQSVFYPSHISLLPIHRQRKDGRFWWPGRENRTL